MIENLSLTLVLWTAVGGAPAEDVLPPQIIHEACEEYTKGQEFTIWAQFRDDSEIFDPKVIFRSGSDTWKPVSFERQPNGDFKAVIKAKDLKGPLEYFIEVFDENGNGPARYGSPDAPVRLAAAAKPEACTQITPLSTPTVVGTSPSGEGARPPPSTSTAAVVTPPPKSPPPAIVQQPPPPAQSTCDREDRPLYCSPVLWSAIGVVVLAGAGVGTYFIATKSSSEPSPPDYVRVSVTAPDPTSVPLVLGGAR